MTTSFSLQIPFSPASFPSPLLSFLLSPCKRFCSKHTAHCCVLCVRGLFAKDGFYAVEVSHRVRCCVSAFFRKCGHIASLRRATTLVYFTVCAGQPSSPPHHCRPVPQSLLILRKVLDWFCVSFVRRDTLTNFSFYI